ncbi:MAG: hypothetical protein K2Q09_01085 [Phycisphaerales bacterium]|nr:hypothetical protein [Phycisphaerales bacterium]
MQRPIPESTPDRSIAVRAAATASEGTTSTVTGPQGRQPPRDARVQLARATTVPATYSTFFSGAGGSAVPAVGQRVTTTANTL